MSKKHIHNQAAIPLAPPAIKKPHIRPMIAEYDPKKGVKNDLSEVVMAKYKIEQNEVPVEQEAGSTLPLVEMAGRDIPPDADYNPFEHRKLAHPTSDMDTLIHLLKGSLGSGILAMPMAFLNAGLIVGLIATCAIGVICTHCVQILVKTSHVLCRRTQVPSLGYAETAEAAFLAGPREAQKFSRLAKAMVNIFLTIDLLGCCCVYIVFVGDSTKSIVDGSFDPTSTEEAPFYYKADVRYHMIILLPILILFNLIRSLKFMAPFSMVANILIATGMAITFYYIFVDFPTINESHQYFAGWSKLPMFFGTAIFALEGIGVVMPLENNMKTPNHFIGCPGVLNFGMFFVVSLYTFTGFFGYLKYGDKTKASITLNLPDDVLGKCVKGMIAGAIFLTYNIQFYVPMEIIWKNVKHRFGAKKNLAEYTIRIALICLTMAIAIAIPNLGPFISLVGAVCLSTLGLMFPAILEIVTFWDVPNGLGRYNWIMWKDLFLIAFGILGFFTGSYVSIIDIINGHFIE